MSLRKTLIGACQNILTGKYYSTAIYLANIQLIPFYTNRKSVFDVRCFRNVMILSTKQ